MYLELNVNFFGVVIAPETPFFRNSITFSLSRSLLTVYYHELFKITPESKMVENAVLLFNFCCSSKHVQKQVRIDIIFYK